jgi:serine/threonine protein kinase
MNTTPLPPTPGPEPLSSGAVAPEVEPSTVELILSALGRSAKNIKREAASLSNELVQEVPKGQLRHGVMVAGYRIIRHLGKGGMADVYEAIHLRLRRRVALKVMVLDEDRPELAARFLREARTMMQVRHRHVTTIHDAGIAEGRHFLALEYIAGGDLAARLEKHGPLGIDLAIQIMIGCCEGLAVIHATGLVHRDIKPANIFLTEDHIPKIGDFGLARSTSGTDRMTVTGVGWGTPSYMAPEQIVGAADVDGRADIYALGATFYTMLTGQEPFSGVTSYMTTFKAMTEAFPDPRLINPAIPPAVAAIIRMATNRERESRYSSVRRLGEDLQRLVRQKILFHASAHSVPLAEQLPQQARGKATVERVEKKRPSLAQHSSTKRGRRAVIGVGLSMLGLAWWGLGDVGTSALVQIPRPSWATHDGRDAAGAWVDVTVGAATTRLRYRPAGSFLLGSPTHEAERASSETRHLVTLTSGFWMQETECDQAFYAAVTGINPSRHRGENLPVEQVSWFDANGFCLLLEERGIPAGLPSEAQWEYACRAGGEEAFAVSDALSASPRPSIWVAQNKLQAAWREGEGAAQQFCQAHPDDLTLRSQPVGRLPPNAAGFFDMHGNVEEWCADRWDGRQAYADQPQNDPRANAGKLAVVRGGSWFHPPSRARSAAREALPPTAQRDDLGFRFIILDQVNAAPTNK